MPSITDAVTEYMRLEKAANADMRGADHVKILADVASKHGIDSAILTEAVLDHSFSGAN